MDLRRTPATKDSRLFPEPMNDFAKQWRQALDHEYRAVTNPYSSWRAKRSEVKNRLDKGEHFMLIDVREDNEWNLGRIPTAIHLGKGIIERDIESVFEDRSAELILYCQGGFRSALAAESLNKMGFQNVFSMRGGFGAWVENEFSISQ